MSEQALAPCESCGRLVDYDEAKGCPVGCVKYLCPNCQNHHTHRFDEGD